MASSKAVQVTLPDDMYEELLSLGEYYQVGPATLASQLLRGVLQPLAAAGVERGPVEYIKLGESPSKAFPHRVNWRCRPDASYESGEFCHSSTKCEHDNYPWLVERKKELNGTTLSNVYQCRGCGLYFARPYDVASLLPHEYQEAKYFTWLD